MWGGVVRYRVILVKHRGEQTRLRCLNSEPDPQSQSASAVCGGGGSGSSCLPAVHAVWLNTQNLRGLAAKYP